jgi:hypothetical protein
MNSHGSTQGEDAVAHLQRAADDGLPVLIPGTREVRVSRPSTQVAVAAPGPRLDLRAAIDASDPAGLERQREGGGAPGERSEARDRSVLAWLGEWFGRGIDVLRAAPGTPPGNGRT